MNNLQEVNQTPNIDIKLLYRVQHELASSFDLEIRRTQLEMSVLYMNCHQTLKIESASS
jgi:hypothetical protein